MCRAFVHGRRRGPYRQIDQKHRRQKENGLAGGNRRGRWCLRGKTYLWSKESGNSKTTSPTGTRKSNCFGLASRSNHTAPAAFWLDCREASARATTLICEEGLNSALCSLTSCTVASCCAR